MLNFLDKTIELSQVFSTTVHGRIANTFVSFYLYSSTLCYWNSIKLQVAVTVLPERVIHDRVTSVATIATVLIKRQKYGWTTIKVQYQYKKISYPNKVNYALYAICWVQFKVRKYGILFVLDDSYKEKKNDSIKWIRKYIHIYFVYISVPIHFI